MEMMPEALGYSLCGESSIRREDGRLESDKLEPIAVTGFSLKFPQDATSPEGFWQMMLHGRSAMTDVPKDRWNVDAFYHPDSDRQDCTNARGGHFLKQDLALFDAPFFSLPSAEAQCMDPQHRSLLECTYHALENAGLPLAKVFGSRTAVYVGSMASEYGRLAGKDLLMNGKYIAVGAGPAMLANRISWFYDLRGPSISLDTACSSSLNALHLAVESLQSGESDMGLVAGCNLILNPEALSISLSNLGFLSPDSVCYSFDHRANGYARGEGTAVLVLKRLSQAVRDKDLIRAVIRATGTNQDGKTPGITQPSRDAQETLIRETYAKGGLDLRETNFFEAHGTGTPIGDPTEAAAIGAVFKDLRTTPLLIGALKSNIGHLEGAAGLAGLIKTILILEKGVIPPNIWFEKPNPAILADEWKIQFPLKSMQWPSNGLRRASVNSFGYGGSNAHVVIDDAFHYLQSHGLAARHCSVGSTSRVGDPVSADRALSDRESSTVPRPKLFVWSAADRGGLSRLATAFQDYLESLNYEVLHKGFLDSLAYTLSNRRSNLPWKSFLVADSVNSICEGLTRDQLSKPVRSSFELAPILGFVFTGQGGQWHGMGRELLIYPPFRKSLQSAEKYLQSLGCTWMLIDELSKSEELSNIDNPAYSQPLCTALQIALIELLASWNIMPVAVIGHSSGEIAAAYCVGGLSRESAWKIAYFRGVLAGRLAESGRRRGSMLAVALSQEEVQKYLAEVAVQLGTGCLSIGCINSPSNLTITGDEKSIDALFSLLDRDHIFARKLRVTVAYHSPHMEQIASEYRSLIRDIAPGCLQTHATSKPILFSSVSGRHIAMDELCTVDHWVTNMVSQVKFSEALSRMCSSLLTNVSNPTDKPSITLIEVGPHALLARPVKETLHTNPEFKDVSYDTTLFHHVSALQSVLELIGRLHCSGFAVDQMAINSPGLSESELELIPNLPEYPFNHMNSYWLESKISQNFRFRKYPRHELLGIATEDQNPLEARWRNFLRISENPWIKDHKEGMMVMAIEAARQMAKSAFTVHAYRIEGVSIFKPLMISLNPEGVETQFHMRYNKANTSQFEDHHTFHLYSYATDEWVEICRGSIITEYAADSEKDETAVAFPSRDLRQRLETSISRCKKILDPQDLYENLASFGFWFGPSFRMLKNVCFGNDYAATATVDPREWMTKVSGSHLVQDHVIHPIALDAVLHLTVVALSNGTWEPVRTMVPTKIGKLWISGDLLAHAKNQTLDLCTHPMLRGYRDVEGSIYAFDSSSQECKILVEGYRATAISDLESSLSEEFLSKRLCFEIEWKPDLDLLLPEQIPFHCDTDKKATEFLLPEAVERLELCCLHVMNDALDTISMKALQSSKPHVARYVAWMEHMCHLYEANVLLPHIQHGRPSLKDTAYFEELICSAGDTAEEKLYLTAARNLKSILCEEVDALSLLFDSNLLQKFYTSPIFTITGQKAANYVDLLAHKNPTLKIIEIGAGTGGATAAILERLIRNGRGEECSPRYSQYVYTDISPGFFQSAQERFSKHSNRVLYKVLDIEKDPSSQGFEPGMYDLVVAASVLHATSSIDGALRNCRKLLKPDGKLILIEPTNLEAVRIPFVFGLLPGWWLSSEDSRYLCPLLSDIQWQQALTKNGFSNDEICLPDYEDAKHVLSIIVASNADAKHTTTPEPRILVIIEDESALQTHVASEIKIRLEARGASDCDIVPFRKISTKDVKGTFCIVLLELDRSLLSNVVEEDFDNIKTMSQFARGIIWLTRGRNERPELGLITGLSRAVSSESANLDFIELALDAKSPDASITQQIIRVYDNSRNKPVECVELDYMEKNGVLYVNRIIEACYLNEKLQLKFAPQAPEMHRLGQTQGRSLSLTIRSPGLLSTFQFCDNHILERSLGEDEVEIEVKAAGVNFKDVMVALGQIPGNSLGLECSGIVLRVGSQVRETQLKPGDRVCCFGNDAFSTRFRTYCNAVAKIPDSMTFTTAAAFPVNFVTAYYALVHVTRLQQDERILIHSGAGGTGQAAIQLAKLLNAEIYTTVGSTKKKDFLMERYQIPEDHIFVGRDVSFAEKLMQMTGEGVHVVLNSMSGEGLQKSLDCLAPFGRFADITKTDVLDFGSLPKSNFAKNITYSSLDLFLVYQKSRLLMKDLLNSVIELATDGRINVAQPLNIYRSSELEDAFRMLQVGKSIGKAVIEMHQDDLVPIMPSIKPTYHFSGESSYVITGGLGGLGRSIAAWMVERGAKYLILLGRSGTRHEKALDFVRDLESRGITVAAPPCDICEEEVLRSTLNECLQFMPSIKGCIQGSMVLRDGLFESMSVDDYNAAVKPKLQGSWNLHLHLPQEMDFFILLSSAGGVIGSRGQSNYGSGNTYQDALAYHRTSHGQKCFSLDLGLIRSVGYAAENREVMSNIKQFGAKGIREAELLTMLDYLCDPSLPIPSPSASQIVVGLEIPPKAKGKDPSGASHIRWIHRPLFRGLAQMEGFEATLSAQSSSSSSSSEPTIDYESLFKAAGSPAGACSYVSEGIRKKLSRIISIPEEDIDLQMPMHRFGVDSLVAVEIRYWLAKEMKADMSIFEIMGDRSLAALSLLVAGRSGFLNE